MAIRTTPSATPLSLWEPILIGTVVATVLINGAVPQISNWLSYPAWFGTIHAGLIFGQSLLVITLSGLAGRTWLGAYVMSLIISWLFLGAWMISETWQYQATDPDMYAPLWAVPLSLLVAASASFGLRQFFGLQLARESDRPWSRRPMSIGDVFTAIALAGSLLVFARAPLLSGYMLREEFWQSLGGLCLMGIGMGLFLATPAIWCVFMLKTRWGTSLGLLGLGLFPVACAAVITPLAVPRQELVAQTVDAVTTSALLSAVASIFFAGLLLVFWARGYRLLRVPYREANAAPERTPRSRWVVGAIVLVAAIMNFVFAPIEETHQRRLRSREHILSFGGKYSLTGNNVSALDLTGTDVRDGDLEFAGDLQSITRLTLDRTAITDAGLEHIARLHDLRELSLNKTRVTDRGLAYLRELPNLTKVSLIDTKVTGACFAQMEAQHTVTELVLTRAAVTDDGCAGIGKLGALSSLDLTETQITDEGFKHLANLTQLNLLRLHKTAVRCDNVSGFSEMRQLNELDLSQTPTQSGISHVVSQCPNLTILSLRYSELIDDGVAELGGHPSLESLDLSGTNVTDEGLSAIGELPRLRHLYLIDTAVVGTGFTGLSAPKLETLQLQYTSVKNDALANLARFPKLRTLSLSDTNITGAGLRHLEGVPLEELWITGTKITAQGILDADLDVEVIGVETNRFTGADREAIQQEVANLNEILMPIVPKARD